MEIDGIPVHPLVVHAAVIFGPVAALLAIAYAVVPGWRHALRWPALACVLVAAGAAVLATASGEDLASARGLEDLPAVEEHEDLGELFRNLVLVLVVVVGLAGWRLRGPRDAGADDRPGSRLTSLAVSAIVVVLAVAVIAVGVEAGHSGARSVWGG